MSTRIAILIFDELTALDAIGPYEVLSRIPGVELRFVAREPGVKRTDTGALGMEADLALGDLPDPDVVLVPGGQGNRPLLEDDEVLDWLRAVHEGTTWTTSVCTGSLVNFSGSEEPVSRRNAIMTAATPAARMPAEIHSSQRWVFGELSLGADVCIA